MALTRSRHRRNVWLGVLALTSVVVVIFAHDVSTIAHQATSVRASENSSFVTLADSLISSENALDTNIVSLVEGTGASTRMNLLIELRVLNAQLASLDARASLLPGPSVGGGLDRQLAVMTRSRVVAYGDILAYVAGNLTLPWTTPAPPSVGVAQTTLLSSADSWGALRHRLESSPGGGTLSSLSSALGSVNLPQALSSLNSRSAFVLTRQFSIAALEVQPSPLQAPRGTLSMPPVPSMSVTAALDNNAVDTQDLVVTFTLTPSTGRSLSVTRSAIIGPLNSVGLSPVVLPLAAGETGRLTVTATGNGLTRSRTYALVVAPNVPLSLG
jgi:hypothetical protein